jgi:hypothetical protein
VIIRGRFIRASTIRCAGLIGCYWYKNSLIGVQAAGTYRVVRWFLSINGEWVRATKSFWNGVRRWQASNHRGHPGITVLFTLGATTSVL